VSILCPYGYFHDGLFFGSCAYMGIFNWMTCTMNFNLLYAGISHSYKSSLTLFWDAVKWLGNILFSCFYNLWLSSTATTSPQPGECAKLHTSVLTACAITWWVSQCSRGNCRAHFTCFSPLRDHWPSLPHMQCLQNYCLVYFV